MERRGLGGWDASRGHFWIAAKAVKWAASSANVAGGEGCVTTARLVGDTGPCCDAGAVPGPAKHPPG